MGKIAKRTKVFQKKNLKRVIEQRRKHKANPAVKRIIEQKKTRELKAAKEKLQQKETGSKTTNELKESKNKNSKKDEDEEIEDELGFQSESEVSDLSDFELTDNEEDEADKLSLKDEHSEEEEEEEEAEITSERIEKVGEELSFHKEELERLKSKDPEFYKFLAENDRKLLDFDDEEEEDDEEDDEEEDENAADETDEDEEQKEISSNEEKEVPAHLMEEGSSKSRIQLTMKHLTHWETSLKQKITIPILREVLHGFKAAAHIHDEELDGKKGENFDGKVTGNLKYAITSPTIFSAVLNISMNFVPAAFDELVKFDSSNSHKSLPNMNSSLWKKHKTMIKSFFGNLLHLFLQTNESAMACFLIKHMENNMAYICSFPKMLKLVMKTLLQHWATDAEEKNRVVSFLAIRKMILTAPYPFIDICLKSSYLSFVRNCKFTSTHTISSIVFMQNCLVELYGINLECSYQHAFMYIRQLAIHLRNAITSKTKDSFQQVYNWQFIHCLGVWSKVISSYYSAEYTDSKSKAQPSSKGLNPLLYPLVQIILGTANLIPTSRYLPIRFHCISYLNLLSKFCGVYIQSGSFLLSGVLQNADVLSKPKPSSSKPVDMSLLLKVSKSYIQTKTFQDICIRKFCTLILGHVSCYACQVGFPELAFPIVNHLKKFLKTCRNSSHKASVKSVMDKIVSQMDFIIKERSHLNFAPWQTKELNAWTEKLEDSGKNSLKTCFESWEKAEQLVTAQIVQEKQDKHEESSLDSDSDLSEHESSASEFLNHSKQSMISRSKKNTKPLKNLPAAKEEEEDDETIQLDRPDILQDFDQMFED